MADRIGADDSGNNESDVTAKTSINLSVSSPSNSSSPEDSRRSKEEKAFLQHRISSEAASENSSGRRSTCSSKLIMLSSIFLHVTSLVVNECDRGDEWEMSYMVSGVTSEAWMIGWTTCGGENMRLEKCVLGISGTTGNHAIVGWNGCRGYLRRNGYMVWFRERKAG